MTFFNKNNSKSTTSCNVKYYSDFLNKDIPIPNSTPCSKSSPNNTPGHESSPYFSHISSSESSPSVSSHKSLHKDNSNNISNPCKEKK